VLAALIEKRVVDVGYFKGDERVVTGKKLQPVKLMLYKNELFLFCASPYKEEWNFPIKVSRIDNATLTNIKFSISPARKKAIEAQLRASFGLFDGPDNPPQKVVIKFCESAEYHRKIFSEQRYHHSQKITHDKKGNLLVTMTVPVGFDLVNWVLQWPFGEVVEPKALRTALLERAQDLQEIYGATG
jgi:hypothetical protein